jgi:hypothetical protein
MSMNLPFEFVATVGVLHATNDHDGRVVVGASCTIARLGISYRSRRERNSWLFGGIVFADPLFCGVQHYLN